LLNPAAAKNRDHAAAQMASDQFWHAQKLACEWSKTAAAS
jgi:hypothetical protein